MHVSSFRQHGQMTMNRPLTVIAAILLFLTPALACAQGLLIVVDPNEQVRLPRPMVIWPPHPHPIPYPVPPPSTSYTIKELSVSARLIDQVAQVQVSQTFVNTGSRPMEVAFARTCVPSGRRILSVQGAYAAFTGVRSHRRAAKASPRLLSRFRTRRLSAPARASSTAIALAALGKAGCHLLPAETVFYALLNDARHPFFRGYTALVKKYT